MNIYIATDYPNPSESKSKYNLGVVIADSEQAAQTLVTDLLILLGMDVKTVLSSNVTVELFDNGKPNVRLFYG